MISDEDLKEELTPFTQLNNWKEELRVTAWFTVLWGILIALWAFHFYWGVAMTVLGSYLLGDLFVSHVFVRVEDKKAFFPLPKYFGLREPDTRYNRAYGLFLIGILTSALVAGLIIDHIGLFKGTGFGVNVAFPIVSSLLLSGGLYVDFAYQLYR